jgi:hypothetical protein
MSYVSQELIDETWRAVGALSGEQVLRTQKSHSKAQRALTMFVYVIFSEFREDASGVGIYVYHVVLEAFSRARPRPRSIRRAHIKRAWHDHDQGSDLDPEDLIEQSPEPHALRYVYEALTEDQDDVGLSEHEREHIFRLMQAVITCLHDACERR